MKILFDNGTPKPIARGLTGHEISYARQIGWQELENGELIEGPSKPGLKFSSARTGTFSIDRTCQGAKSLWRISVIRDGQWYTVVPRRRESCSRDKNGVIGKFERQRP